MTKRNRQKEIAQLVDSFQLLQQTQSRVGEVGANENLFALFNISVDEVSHSALLAWLFDPAGSHGQGSRFLQAFLNVAQPEIALQLPETYRVQTEFSRMTSIVDIAVFKAKTFILFIENKTTSPDTPGQHDREIKDLRRLGVTLQVPLERQFPIYLTPYGRQTQGKHTHAWRRVAYHDLGLAFSRVRQEVSDERTRLILKDWLETITIFGGTWRRTMTGFSETSVLLGACWPTVLDIERARGQFNEELLALLFSMEDILAEQGWWSQGWTFRRYKNEIYIWNTNWLDAQGYTPLWMGVYAFNADRVLGPQAPPIFYFRTRKNYEALGDVLCEALRAEGHEVLKNHRHLVHRAILQCPHDRAAVVAYPMQVREQMAALFAEYAGFAMRHEDVIQSHIEKKGAVGRVDEGAI